MDSRIKQIAACNGFKVICNKTFEELGELNTALARYQAESDTHYEGIVEDLMIHHEVRDDLVSELADVEITTKQLIYNLHLEKEVKEMIEYKINRQLERMEKENGKV
jgi:hypothetical protein